MTSRSCLTGARDERHTHRLPADQVSATARVPSGRCPAPPSDPDAAVPLAGPFLVRSQAAPRQSVRDGAAGTIRWAVHGTNTRALAKRVRITLSTDGGRTFDRVLAANTPNDGSQAVTWPVVATGQARIKVEAVGNYFLAVNAAPFPITR